MIFEVMNAYDIIMIHQILWGVGIFTLGMLAGYMLKVVMVNYERIKARKDNWVKEIFVEAAKYLYEMCKKFNIQEKTPALKKLKLDKNNKNDSNNNNKQKKKCC